MTDTLFHKNPKVAWNNNKEQPVHYVDTANSQTVTSAEAAPASAWQGDWSLTREFAVTRILVVLAATDQTVDGLGGTFIFEFSDDGVSHNGISETRTIGDFSTVRDFDLLNAGNYFRISFEPDRALSSDSVFITTTFRKGFDGAFVRLGNQEIEEQNAALPSQFAYMKGFRTNGKSIGVTLSRGGSVSTTDEGFEVARGNIAGRSAVHLEGRNSDIDTASAPEDVWFGGDDYTGNPTGSPETVEIFSSDANDTSAGTGAQTARIMGLATSDSTAYTTEDFALNGTTAVTSVGTWYRIVDCRILTAGSGGTNAGTLTVRHTTTTANVFAQVAAGVGQSAIGSYTVPAERTLFLTRVRVAITRANGSAGSAQVLMLVREFGTGAWYALRNFELATQAGVGFTLNVPLEIPAKADIKFRVVSVSDNDTIATAFFDGILVDD